MNATMADYVRTVQAALPGELVSRAAVDRIVAVASRLPPCTLAGFECRLGLDEWTVDFQVAVPGQVLLPPTGYDANEQDRTLRSLCGGWIERTALIAAGVDAAGCEFDLGGVEDHPPGVFLALSTATAEERSLLLAIADALIAGLPETIERILLRCVDALPDGGRIKFIGAMPARRPKALRVNAYGVSDAEDYLELVGWSYPTEPVEHMLRAVEPLTDALVLCLDLSDVLLPRIGIECILDEQPSTEPRWPQLLDVMVTLGACTPAKRDALLRWEGLTTRSSASGPWPPNLEWGDSVLGRSRSAFHRYLSHLKLVHLPGCAPQAKAYLGFFHSWSDAQVRASGDEVAHGVTR